jgi:hypothetical protein
MPWPVYLNAFECGNGGHSLQTNLSLPAMNLKVLLQKKVEAFDI